MELITAWEKPAVYGGGSHSAVGIAALRASSCAGTRRAALVGPVEPCQRGGDRGRLPHHAVLTDPTTSRRWLLGEFGCGGLESNRRMRPQWCAGLRLVVVAQELLQAICIHDVLASQVGATSGGMATIPSRHSVCNAMLKGEFSWHSQQLGLGYFDARSKVIGCRVGHIRTVNRWDSGDLFRRM